MVFNATFNIISVISWRSVLLVEETGVPGENHRPVASHWQTLSHNVVSCYKRRFINSNKSYLEVKKLFWEKNTLQLKLNKTDNRIKWHKLQGQHIHIFKFFIYFIIDDGKNNYVPSSFIDRWCGVFYRYRRSILFTNIYDDGVLIIRYYTYTWQAGVYV